MSRHEFTEQFDTFVRAQLDTIVEGTAAPKGISDAKAPYQELPLIAHYAIYTLNLIVLRVVVSNTVLVIEDKSAGPRQRSRSTWDRLIHLWRSWFDLDSLADVATILDSRRERAQVHVQAREEFSEVSSRTKLETAWRATSALADRPAAGALAVHLHDAGDSHPIDLDVVGVELGTEGLDLDLEIQMRLLRESGWPHDMHKLEGLARHGRRAAALEATSRSHRDLLVALTGHDAPPAVRIEVSRVLRSPRATSDVWSKPESFAVAFIGFCASVEPRWAAEMVSETLRRDEAEDLARSKPKAFAACLDLPFPPGIPDYVLPGFEDATWFDPHIRRLTYADLDLIVLVALLDLATRVAPHVEDSTLVSSCTERVVGMGRDAFPKLPLRQLRRLIVIADATDYTLAEWLLSAARVLLKSSLPADVVLDLERLQLRLNGVTRIASASVEAWPILRSEADMAALRRLVESLDDGDDDPDASLGREGLLRYLSDAESPGLRLRLARDFLAS